MKKFKLSNRLICCVISLILSMLCVTPLLAATSPLYFSSVRQFDIDVATDIVNLYAESNEDFSINKFRSINNSLGKAAYILAELLPYGYALFNNSNCLLLEANFSEGSVAPVPLEDENDYMYVGPSTFAVMEKNNLVLTDNGHSLSAQDVQWVVDFESAINGVDKNQLGYVYNSNEIRTPISSAISTYTDSVGIAYFPRLNDHGTNTEGTCTVLAAAMLIGYYRHNVNSNYIASQYVTQGSSSSSAGTTEAFHQLLCTYVYGDGERGGISICNAAEGINNYLNSRPVAGRIVANTDKNVKLTQDTMIECITERRPAIASCGKGYGASINHTMLVYGIKYTYRSDVEINSSSLPPVNYNSLMYRVHYGHGSSKNDVWVTSAWFYRYGYISESN